MTLDIKHKTKALIQYIICIALFFVFQISAFFLDSANLSYFSGVCLAFQYGVCLVLVRTNKRKGIITSMVLLGLALLNIIRVILISNAYLPFSGLFNILFYIVTIAWLGAIFAKQEKAAVTDILTGLLNRRGLNQQLISLIEDEKPFYLINIEIGNFKLLNDSYGHIYGDLILKKITKRLIDYVGNRGMVTRNTGAEFVIILKNTDNAAQDADEMIKILTEKIVLSSDGDYLDCYLTVFAGISSYPKDSSNYEELINYAIWRWLKQCGKIRFRRMCSTPKWRKMQSVKWSLSA